MTCPNIVDSCPHKRSENRFLTIGQVYFLSKIVQTRNIDDREFLVNIITGKSLIEEVDQSDFLYTPMDHLEDDWLDLFPDFSPLDSKEAQTTKATTFSKDEMGNVITQYRNTVTKVLKNLKGERIQKTIDVLSKLKDDEDVDQRFVKNLLHRIQVKSITHTLLSYKEYINLITQFITSNDLKISSIDVHHILTYLLTAFEPMNKLDFPNVQVDKAKITRLRQRTFDIDDEHPFKWTKERTYKLYKEKNPYTKLVYFDSHLYLWLKFVQDNKISLFSEADIRAKKILDDLIRELSQFYVTNLIVLPYYSDSKFYDRIKEVFHDIFQIINSHPAQFNLPGTLKEFFLPEQLENQYRIIKEVDFKLDIFSTIGVAVPSSNQVFKVLKEKELVEVFKFLQ